MRVNVKKVTNILDLKQRTVESLRKIFIRI